MSLKKILPFLLAFVLPLVLVYAWWGGFNAVELAVQERGPYTYAYVQHTGDYAKLADRLGQVHKALEAAGITPGAAISILYSNPAQVARSQRRARVGYLVDPGSAPPPPLELDSLPARQAFTARVRAAIMLAPSRAYQALDEHLQAQGQGITMPTVEIYEESSDFFSMGVLTVEVAAP